MGLRQHDSLSKVQVIQINKYSNFQHLITMITLINDNLVSNLESQTGQELTICFHTTATVSFLGYSLIFQSIILFDCPLRIIKDLS